MPLTTSNLAFENLSVNIENNILKVTVNRPDKLNALNKITIKELKQAVEFANANNEIRGVLITGAGNKAFVAGADISEFTGLEVEEGKRLSAEGHAVFNLIENCRKPVIAAVNGFALGGGCELAMACHMRIASDNAKFGQPEVKLGLIPGYGGTQRLTNLIGKTKALELMITADMISAEEALRLGLVNHVTTLENLYITCDKIFDKIKQQSPAAIAGVIASVNACMAEGVDGFATEINEFAKCFSTEDFREGTMAFIEKRTPNFKGN